MGIGSLPPAPPPITGLPNWPINLENSSQQVIASTVTDAHGNYSFTSVAAGTYTVAEVQQTGWTQFAPASPGTYTVTVTSDQVVAGLDFGNSQNSPPTVDPGPAFSSSYVGDTNATAGQKYTYTAVAADTDHDQITYSLGLAQPGMVIDPTYGVLDWTPSANQVGFQNVDIVATDSNGNIGTQEYAILVGPADQPPVITTTALPTAYPDLAYSYQITAVSPDNYPFTFSLTRKRGHNELLSVISVGGTIWACPGPLEPQSPTRGITS